VSANVELVRRSFEAMSAWDVDALLRLYDRDVEFLPLTGTRVESGGYQGHEGVRAYFAEARDLWDVMEPEGHDYRDLGDCIVVAGRCRVAVASAAPRAIRRAPGWSGYATERSSLTEPAPPTTKRSKRLAPVPAQGHPSG
jgi:ketosteroid isomerase-like protein